MSEEHVRVEVTRSGGITGMTRTASADTDALDQTRAEELRRLVGASRASAPARGAGRPSTPSGADRFQFDITVRRDGEEEKYVRHEPDLTPEEQQLVRLVLSGNEGTRP